MSNLSALETAATSIAELFEQLSVIWGAKYRCRGEVHLTYEGDTRIFVGYRRRDKGWHIPIIVKDDKCIELSVDNITNASLEITNLAIGALGSLGMQLEAASRKQLAQTVAAEKELRAYVESQGD